MLHNNVEKGECPEDREKRGNLLFDDFILQGGLDAGV